MSTASEHDPKVQIFGVHARYANAIYTATSKKFGAKGLAALESDLTELQGHMNTHEQFAYVMKSPQFAGDVKLDVLKKITKSEMAPALFAVLSENGRLGQLGQVADVYTQLMQAGRNQSMVTITSASKMTKGESKDVLKNLKGLVEDGKEVVLEEVVDPSILGGLKIQIDDRFIDLSVATKVRKVQEELALSV
jgi:F-type H+-transporting ATPase subunit O